MKKHPPPQAITRARQLRRDMTDAERALWTTLRAHFKDWHFRRQVPLQHYIADFASHRARLVIEVDGGQHGGADDARRTAVIETEGYQVLRFWNNEVMTNEAGVFEIISRALAEVAPPSKLR